MSIVYSTPVALRGAKHETTNLGDTKMNDAAVYGFRQIAGAMGCKDAQQHTGKSYEQMMAEVEAMQAKLRAIRQEMDAFVAAN